MRAARSTPLIDDILKAKPRRIILNPGAENEELEKAASSAGIETVKDALWSCGGWDVLAHSFLPVIAALETFRILTLARINSIRASIFGTMLTGK